MNKIISDKIANIHEIRQHWQQLIVVDHKDIDQHLS